MQAPSATDITNGLDLAFLSDLTERQRETLTALLARASERAYRRGVQQGAAFASDPGRLRPELHDWRYENPTDASPWADSARVETAVERLHLENNRLRTLGLPEEVRSVGVIDLDGVTSRLHAAAAEYQRVWTGPADSRAVGIAKSRLTAIGIELHTVGGFKAMVDAYDELVELHGQMAARGINEAWTLIGGWSA